MKKLLLTLVLGLLLCGGSLTAYANNQTAVIGVGLGVHTFDTIDDVRGKFLVPGDELKDAAMSQLYVEWYALGALGFGLRSIGIVAARDYVDSAGNKLKHEVNVGLGFLTAQWILLGSEGYTRLGLIGGVGNGIYESKLTTTDAATGIETSASDSTSGSASLGGLFLDWGGEDFGARFGVHKIQTAFDKLNGLDVDGSGTSVYLDLRWAFK